MEYVALSNGIQMPIFGIGTYEPVLGIPGVLKPKYEKIYPRASHYGHSAVSQSII